MREKGRDVHGLHRYACTHAKSHQALIECSSMQAVLLTQLLLELGMHAMTISCQCQHPHELHGVIGWYAFMTGPGVGQNCVSCPRPSICAAGYNSTAQADVCATSAAAQSQHGHAGQWTAVCNGSSWWLSRLKEGKCHAAGCEQVSVPIVSKAVTGYHANVCCTACQQYCHEHLSQVLC